MLFKSFRTAMADRSIAFFLGCVFLILSVFVQGCASTPSVELPKVEYVTKP